MDSLHPTDRFRAVFDESVELPPGERAAHLDRACGGDAKLRAAVESLLSAHDRAGSFLADPSIPPEMFDAADRPAPGSRIDRYTLLRIVGEGGFGTVFLAEQDPPLHRRVALKLIKPGMDVGPVIARFDLERQALARMDHPNIARVFDAGSTTDGRPYFVMEFVDGIPITEFCQKYTLSVDARLGLFSTVCGAVHHAHERGVIHRDLKPANVLVVLHGGEAFPKVIDFGIAKALFPGRGGEGDDPPITGSGPAMLQPQLLGTPQYMSPEQAVIPPGRIDRRTDVYALGVLLYEMLTDLPPFGRAAFERAAHAEIGRILRDLDPPPPSARLESSQAHLAPNDQAEPEARRRALLVRGDLDRIVVRAMAKDPRARYDTAATLAADVQRHLDARPIAARAPSLPRARRVLARRRRPLGLIAVLIVAVLVALVLLAGNGLRPRTQPVGPWVRTDLAEPPAASLPLEPGLYAEIYNGSRFESLRQVRIDPRIDFTWPRGVAPAPGIRPPRYSVRWQGILLAPPGGIAGVGAEVDDGIRILIDGRQLVARDRPGRSMAEATLAPGRHVIEIEYWNRLAEGSVKLLWRRGSAGVGDEAVPAEALFHVRNEAKAPRTQSASGGDGRKS